MTSKSNHSHLTQEEKFLLLEDEQSSVDMRRLFRKVLANWYWLALSVIICFLFAYIYVRFQTPVYRISAKVLVNDEKKGGGIGGASVLGDLGGMLGGKSTVDNEAEILKTRFLMEQVVRDMNLNITYYKAGTVKDEELYDSPFFIEGKKLQDTIKGAHAIIEVLKGNKLAVKTEEVDLVVAFNQNFNLPGIGDLQIKRNFAVPMQDGTYSVSVMPVDSKVAQLMGSLDVAVTNKLITIIDLTLSHTVPKKGEDILNRLIYNYVQINLKDKNEVADSTIKFIQNRLVLIGSELGDLEGNIQGFKQKNNLADMTAQGQLLVTSTGQFVQDLAKVETQISILNGLTNYLRDENVKRVLPGSLITDNLVFSGLIEKYNALLLERDKKLLSVTETNPVILNLDEQIANLRSDMLSNLVSSRKSLEISRNNISQQMQRAEGDIRQVPATERNYLNLARQQQIKQELYIFLMQKSEETAISKTSNIANSRTIDPPKAEVVPFSPKKNRIYLIGMAIGLAIPLAFIYLLELLNTKVNTKEDIIAKTSVSVIGEISHNNEHDNLIVVNHSRSAIAEQFRALRTNLSFYLNGAEEKVILLTSSMAGEGKSFVTVNLGSILALSGKKVILLEFDLRKPGLSVKLGVSNNFGFTNYVIDSSVQLQDIVKPLAINPNLFILSSGPIPPNPAETLMNQRTKDLIDELRNTYDYIIIDAPPVGIVTDAQLMAPFSDMCLYLVRQKYTYKEQLGIVDQLYKDNKMRKIGIVVNDIQASDTYGYGYGYGYGSYGDERQKNSFLKVFKRTFKIFF